MAGENTPTTLNGLFKEVYAPSLEFLMPEGLKLQKRITFVPKDRMPGNSYHQPVVLQHEHGFTYAAAGTDAFNLNSAVSGQIKDATILGTQMLLVSVLGYEAAHRASTGGKRAFVQATQYMVENMWLSAKKRLEIDLFYGQTGLGTLAGAVAGGVMTITAADFAPGVWAGMEGAKVEVFDTTLATQRATGGGATTGTVLAVDLDARTVTLDITLTGTGAGDKVFFLGQVIPGVTPVHNVFKGLDTILTNTGSIFGIDAAAYSLWKANAQSAAAADLSFDVVQQTEAKCVGKGLDTNVCVLVNPKTWAKLLTDQAALRRHGDPNKRSSYEVGAESILFYGQSGYIEIEPSIYVKEGRAFMISDKLFSRVGATDITFRLQDRGDEFFRHSDAKAAYELRAYSNQALFCEAIGKNAIITAIKTY
jgi:hypothetical protein